MPDQEKNNSTQLNGAILTLDGSDHFYERGFIETDGPIIGRLGENRSATINGLDFSRCVLLPGFINAHTHLFLTILRGFNDDLPLFPWLKVLSPAIGLMNTEDMVTSNYAGCFEAIRSGTTTVCECCRYEPQLTAEAASKLGLRSISGGMPASEWFGDPLPTDLPALKANTLLVRDNPERYNNLAAAHIGVHSPYNCSSDFILSVKALADELDLPFNIHLAECQDEVDLIDRRYGQTPVQYLHDLGVLSPGVIANHCVLLNEKDMALFVENGVGVVHNPVSNAKLHSGVAPVGRYLALGINVGLATDSVVSNNSLNMFKEMHFGMLLQRANPQIPGSGLLQPIDFLKMATIGSAHVLGLDHMIGSLEVGKRADLIAVQLPPDVPLEREAIISHLVWSAGPQDVRLVMVDGRVIARDGRLTQVDHAALKNDLTAYCTARRSEISRALAGNQDIHS